MPKYLEVISEFIQQDMRDYTGGTDNCLLICNYLRRRYNQKELPQWLLTDAEVLKSASLVNIKKHFQTLGIEVADADLQDFDIFLLWFSNYCCIGTFIDGFIFYSEGYQLGYKPYNDLKRYVVLQYRLS